jgi:hypothetical protein
MRINKMNLEKKASVSGVIKDLWKNTKELPKNFKEFNKIKKSLPQDINDLSKTNNLMSFLFKREEINGKAKTMLSHLKNIKKGLVIPTVGAGVGIGAGGYKAYKYIKNKREKTAGLKDYWNATKDLGKNIEFLKALENPSRQINYNILNSGKTFDEVQIETLNKIKKGLVIPTAGVATAGVGSYGGYKYLKNKREKTAGLLSDTKNLIKNIKEYRRLTRDYLPYDYFNYVIPSNKLKKSIMRGLVIPGAALGITGAGGTYIYKKTKQPAGVKDYLKTTKKINKDIYKKIKQSVNLKNY